MSEKLSVIKEDIPFVEGAFQLHNIFTLELCNDFIKKTEQLEYNNSSNPEYQTSRTDILELQNRTNSRLVYIASEIEVKFIWEKIKEFIPDTIHNGKWEKSGINKIFRFYKYEVNQYFGLHFDNQFISDTAETSHFSFILYLNDDFENGQTTFLKWINDTAECKLIPIKPKRGSALIFYHTGHLSPLHEGTAHTSVGKTKYVLRSDVMFTKTNVE